MKKLLIVVFISLSLASCGEKSKPANGPVKEAPPASKAASSHSSNDVMRETVYKEVRKKANNPEDFKITRITSCPVKGAPEGTDYVVNGTFTFKDKQNNDVKEQTFVAEYTNIDNTPAANHVDIDAMLAKLSQNIKGKNDQEATKAYLSKNKERMMKIDESSCVDVDADGSQKSR